MAKAKKTIIFSNNGNVTQSYLAWYKKLERMKKRAKARLDNLTAKLSEADAKLIEAWAKGKRAVPGDENIQFEVSEYEKSSPKWKDEAVALAVASGRVKSEFEKEIKDKYNKTKTKVDVF
jgi:Skp family chaperone for outer membrane proteins